MGLKRITKRTYALAGKGTESMSFRNASICVVASVVLLSAASSATAQSQPPDYGRSGFYVGVGGGAGFDFFHKWFEDNTGGIFDISPGGSFNARGGYRLTSWFALEAMYEGVYGMELKIAGQPLLDFSTHSLVGNFKFILPTGWLQPYIMVGPGFQYGDVNGPSLLADERWDFVLRTAVGVDTYFGEHWVFNIELAPSVRFKDYNNIPSAITDNVTLTVGGGLQYRF